MNDTLLRTVTAALEADALVPRGRIRPLLRQATVVLTGDLDWEHQRAAAINAVRGVPGVADVRDELRILPGERRHDLSHRVEAALAASPAIDMQGIAVDVVAARVILRGITPTWAARETAERIACGVPGVAGVENDLLVRTPDAPRRA